VSLKADHFEGGKIDFNKQLNQKFFLSHSVVMGLVEVRPCGLPDIVCLAIQRVLNSRLLRRMAPSYVAGNIRYCSPLHPTCLYPHLLRQMAPYDVTGNVWQALHRGTGAGQPDHQGRLVPRQRHPLLSAMIRENIRASQASACDARALLRLHFFG